MDGKTPDDEMDKELHELVLATINEERSIQ